MLSSASTKPQGTNSEVLWQSDDEEEVHCQTSSEAAGSDAGEILYDSGMSEMSEPASPAHAAEPMQKKRKYTPRRTGCEFIFLNMQAPCQE